MLTKELQARHGEHVALEALEPDPQAPVSVCSRGPWLRVSMYEDAEITFLRDGSAVRMVLVPPVF